MRDGYRVQMNGPEEAQYQRNGGDANSAIQETALGNMKRGFIAGSQAGIAEVVTRYSELDQSQHHADAGCGKAPMPAKGHGEPAANHRPNGRTQIHAHVKNRESR